MNTRNLTAMVAAILTFYLVPAAQADSHPTGICKITAGSAGAFKFATLKCTMKTDPRNYVIRSTSWDSEDLDGYRERARFAGRSFTCDMTQTGKTSAGQTETTHYEISNCR